MSASPSAGGSGTWRTPWTMCTLTSQALPALPSPPTPRLEGASPCFPGSGRLPKPPAYCAGPSSAAPPLAAMAAGWPLGASNSRGPAGPVGPSGSMAAMPAPSADMPGQAPVSLQNPPGAPRSRVTRWAGFIACSRGAGLGAKPHCARCSPDRGRLWPGARCAYSQSFAWRVEPACAASTSATSLRSMRRVESWSRRASDAPSAASSPALKRTMYASCGSVGELPRRTTT
mmetsp:Transcript_25069/g.84034  ORF Transcript_25069/g.84034 Transcript_25069/m.84034 type:complete len:230 (+) Transcript_25069:1355-2044(+)